MNVPGSALATVIPGQNSTLQEPSVVAGPLDASVPSCSGVSLVSYALNFSSASCSSGGRVLNATTTSLLAVLRASFEFKELSAISESEVENPEIADCFSLHSSSWERRTGRWVVVRAAEEAIVEVVAVV